jgi:hypothetical protein
MAYEDHAGHADISRLEKRSNTQNHIISPALVDADEAIRPYDQTTVAPLCEGDTPTHNRPGLRRRPGYDTGSQKPAVGC